MAPLFEVTSRRRLAVGMALLGAIAAAVTAQACSSPTGPGETVLLEGDLMGLESRTHVVAVPNTGVTTITILDLRKLIWDVTLGDTTSSLSLGIGRSRTEGCEITGSVVVREGETYLWSLQKGDQCFVLSDPGTIPVDGVLAYSVQLELPS